MEEGLSRVWTDAYGTEYGQDAGNGQIYRLSDKGKKLTLAHVPPISDVEAVVVPVTPEPTIPEIGTSVETIPNETPVV